MQKRRLGEAGAQFLLPRPLCLLFLLPRVQGDLQENLAKVLGHRCAPEVTPDKVIDYSANFNAGSLSRCLDKVFNCYLILKNLHICSCYFLVTLIMIFFQIRKEAACMVKNPPTENFL